MLFRSKRAGAAAMLTFPGPPFAYERFTVELWRAFVDGTPTVKLDTMVDGNIGAVRLHPVGWQIAFQVRTPRMPGEIWVAENFLPAPRAAKDTQMNARYLKRARRKSRIEASTTRAGAVSLARRRLRRSAL